MIVQLITLTMLGAFVGLGGLDSFPITDTSFWTISVLGGKFVLAD